MQKKPPVSVKASFARVRRKGRGMRAKGVSKIRRQVWRCIHQILPSSSIDLMCFLINSKDEKKMALTTQDRPMDTPRPRYMCFLKNSSLGFGTGSPFAWRRAFRWYMLLAESMGSAICE